MGKLMDRAFCIVGPPGCGKTFSITKSVQKNIKDYGPKKVIVCSLTRAAATEAAGRVGLPRNQVGTLHSFAYRALDRPVLAETKIQEWNKEHPKLGITNKNSDVNDSFDAGPCAGGGDELYADYSLRRARMQPKDSWPGALRSFAKRWEEWKQSNELMDFTDLIEYAAKDVKVAPGGPSAIYMDEAQDSSLLEAELLRWWSLGVDKSVIVGDPNQSLYAWRGASPEEFFPPDMPQERKWVLGQSYRVPRAVLDMSLRWIRNMPGYVEEPYLPRKDEDDNEVKGKADILPQASLRHPGPLLDHVLKRLKEEKSVMILASCGYMLSPLVNLLRRHGVPFHNPYRRKAGAWNPLHSSGVSGRDRLLAWLAPRSDLWGDKARTWTMRDVQLWASILEAKGVFVRGAKRQMEEAGELDSCSLSERLMSWFEPEALQKVLSLDMEWWQSKVMKNRKKGLEFPLLVFRKHGAHTLAQEPKLIVGTIHSVKGGQADVVYVSPDLSMAGALEWRKRSRSVYRLFYVAMTRAREELYLLGGGGSSNRVGW